MDYLNVLVAAAASFGAGAVWYGVLGKQWQQAANITCDENGKPQGGSHWAFVISAIVMIVVAGMMRHAFAMAGIDTITKGALSGLGVGLFFITPWIFLNNAFVGRPLKLSGIDGGYAVIGCTLIGGILNAF